MKQRILYFAEVWLPALILAACVGTPVQTQAPEPLFPRVEERREYEILDYENREQGADLPEWLSRYMAEGTAGVETLPQYAGSYIFIESDSGTNISALRQWSLGFSLAQDFPRLAAARVQDCLTSAGAGNPERVYGRYFESMIRNVFNARFQGAAKEAECWVYRRYSGDTSAPPQEVYELFIMVRIDREVLKAQLDGVLYRNGNVQASKEQTAAFERLHQVFYERF